MSWYPTGNRRVVCDWDGTLVRQAWPEQPREWMPGAVEALRTFLAAGLEVVVQSCRTAPRNPDEQTVRTPFEVQGEIGYIRETLDSVGLQDVQIWDSRRYQWKPPAIAYIDDRGMHYDGHEDAWEEIAEAVLGLCPGASA